MLQQKNWVLENKCSFEIADSMQSWKILVCFKWTFTQRSIVFFFSYIPKSIEWKLDMDKKVATWIYFKFFMNNLWITFCLWEQSHPVKMQTSILLKTFIFPTAEIKLGQQSCKSKYNQQPMLDQKNLQIFGFNYFNIFYYKINSTIRSKEVLYSHNLQRTLQAIKEQEDVFLTKWQNIQVTFFSFVGAKPTITTGQYQTISIMHVWRILWYSSCWPIVAKYLHFFEFVHNIVNGPIFNGKFQV